VGRALLTATLRHRNGQLHGHLPRSQRAIFFPAEFELVSDPGLMGRVINLAELMRVLEPLWRERIGNAGYGEGSFHVTTSAGDATVRVSNGAVQTRVQDAQPTNEKMVPLSESDFAHLLFHGVDEYARSFVDNSPNAPLLRILFPEQDFVMWESDAF